MKKQILFLALIVSRFSFAASLQATYEVPTSDMNLKPSSVFEIKKISIRKNTNGTTTLKYIVPQELTGKKNVIDFTGDLKNNSGKLSSEYGQMNCLSNTEQMMCSVNYEELDFDSIASAKIMADKFSGQDLANRLVLRDRFSTDPIGVIHIKFSKAFSGF